MQIVHFESKRTKTAATLHPSRFVVVGSSLQGAVRCAHDIPADAIQLSLGQTPTPSRLQPVKIRQQLSRDGLRSGVKAQK